jgi:hypothetical protein
MDRDWLDRCSELRREEAKRDEHGWDSRVARDIVMRTMNDLHHGSCFLDLDRLAGTGPDFHTFHSCRPSDYSRTLHAATKGNQQ